MQGKPCIEVRFIRARRMIAIAGKEDDRHGGCPWQRGGLTERMIGSGTVDG